MTHSEATVKSYLKEIFNLDEEEEIDEIVDLRASFLERPLKHSSDYDNQSHTWYAWKEQFENSLQDFWIEENDKFKELLDVFNFLESHPYDKFQQYTARFKLLLNCRAEILSFDKKEYKNIQVRDLFNIFWGTKTETVAAKQNIMSKLFYKSKEKSYKQLIKDFKLEFPEIYKLEEEFLRNLRANVKKLKKKSGPKNESSSDSNYIWIVCIVIYAAVRACSHLN